MQLTVTIVAGIWMLLRINILENGEHVTQPVAQKWLALK